ncbi:unnamed protein product [Heterobilharzia americana]|nr:unnamed protein product [Heterobilharzia americana]
MTPRHGTEQNTFRIFLVSFLKSPILLHWFSPVTLIEDVVKEAELCIGISSDLSQISFIDKGDLNHLSSLNESNIVNGSTLLVRTSRQLETLFKSIITDHQSRFVKVLPYPSGPFNNVSTEYQKDYITCRLNIALLFASGLNLVRICNVLIGLGANVNAKTKFGRTALHIAAAHSSEQIIENLVERGANMKLKDIFGETALDIAKRYGNHHTANLLQRLNWLQRCKSAKLQYLNIPLAAFQMCDSAYPKWRQNINGQVYLQKLTPRGEYMGTRLNASKWHWPKLDMVLTRKKIHLEAKATNIRVKSAPPTTYTKQRQHPMKKSG